MSKVYTEDDLSRHLDSDLTWRRKELSDLKSAIKNADSIAKQVLLKSLVAMVYAHWEGYVRICASKYFEYLTVRKKRYGELEQQIYVNSFLTRLDALYLSKGSIQSRCKLVDEIINSKENRFSFINPGLIDTKSNLSTDVIKDLCIVCGVDYSCFEDKRSFIDIIILKRRNAIAHGQQESVGESEIDKIIADMLSLMTTFKTLLENKVYTKSYLS